MSQLVCNTPADSAQQTKPEKQFKPNARAGGEVAYMLMGKVSLPALAVAVALARWIPYKFSHLTSYPSWETVRKMTGIGSRSTISKAITELETGGYIRRKSQGHRRSSIYLLTCIAHLHPEAEQGFIDDTNVQAADDQFTLGPVGLSSTPPVLVSSTPAVLQSITPVESIKEESQKERGRLGSASRSSLASGIRVPQVPSQSEETGPDLVAVLETRVRETAKSKKMHSDSFMSGAVLEVTEPRIPIRIQRTAAKFGVHIQPGQTEQEVRALIAQSVLAS